MRYTKDYLEKYHTPDINEQVAATLTGPLATAFGIGSDTIKATIGEIKQNYKKFAKRYHPDAKSDIKNSDEKFRDLVEAYTYLMDYHKK